MIDLLQNTVDGLMIGSSYALLALGFTLIFGVMRRLNLAYGPSIMVGAYFGTLLHLEWSAPPAVVAVAVVLGAALAGYYVQRLCFAPMQRRGGAEAGVASMVSSFVIWMQLEEAAVLVLPRHTYPFPPLAGGQPLRLGELTLRLDHLIVFAAAIGLTLALYLLLYRARFGLALRAVIDNPAAAQHVGIDVAAVMRRAFVLASVIGGFAGWLIAATDAQVTPMLGMWATMKGLIAMMLGGLGSLPGAIVGGLLLGVVEAHGQWYFGPQERELIAYGLLFALLILRPGGLLGQDLARRSAVAARRV